MGAATAVFHLPRMKPQQVHEDLFTIPTARRAVIVVGPVRSVRADPLHLLRRQVLWTEPEDLYVHPRTVALAGSAAGFIRDLEGMPTTDLSSADVSFHALRDYVPGDDRRHIHWKTTARTNKLMVRQFEETRRAHLAISLSINTDEYASEQEFELAISAAASIGRQAIREQRELDVLTQAGPLRCETGRNMLDGMTRIVGRPAAEDRRRPRPDPRRHRPQRLRRVLRGGQPGDAHPAALRRGLGAARRPQPRRAARRRCRAGAGQHRRPHCAHPR